MPKQCNSNQYPRSMIETEVDIITTYSIHEKSILQWTLMYGRVSVITLYRDNFSICIFMHPDFWFSHHVNTTVIGRITISN